MVGEIKYYKELERLQVEHESLEDEIRRLMKSKVIDQFRLHDLKKKKLKAKELISSLQSLIYKDITA